MTAISPTRLALELTGQMSVFAAIVQQGGLYTFPAPYNTVVAWSVLASVLIVAPRYWRWIFRGLAWGCTCGEVALAYLREKSLWLSTWPDWLNRKAVRLRKMVGLYLLRPKSED